MKTTKEVIFILKRQLALLCATGAVFAFSCIYMRTEEGNEAVSLGRIPSAVSEEKDDGYTIKLENSSLMVLNGEGISLLEYTVERESLSSGDIKRLEEGIHADSAESLKRLIEDFTS